MRAGPRGPTSGLWIPADAGGRGLVVGVSVPEPGPAGPGWGRFCGRSGPAALSLKSPLCGWEAGAPWEDGTYTQVGGTESRVCTQTKDRLCLGRGGENATLGAPAARVGAWGGAMRVRVGRAGPCLALLGGDLRLALLLRDCVHNVGTPLAPRLTFPREPGVSHSLGLPMSSPGFVLSSLEESSCVPFSHFIVQPPLHAPDPMLQGYFLKMGEIEKARAFGKLGERLVSSTF